jgi:hypothetical protein
VEHQRPVLALQALDQLERGFGDEASGMNKICYYDYLGSTVAINVSSVSRS